MRKLYKVLIVLVFACSLLSSAESISGNSLLFDLGARGTALAGAGTSLAGDVTFFRYNPAGLASLQNPQLSVLYYNGGELGLNFGSITYGQKFGPGVLALSAAYLNSGEMELNPLVGVAQTVIGQQDVIGCLSYGLEPAKDIEVGLSAKVLASSLFGSLNAQTICGDAGFRMKNILISNLNLGASIANIGTGLKYLDTTELLPVIAAGGVSYSMAFDKIGLLASVDAIFDLSDNNDHLAVGVEVTYEDYALRAGLPLFSELDTIVAVGLGYRMKEFIFDYSISFGKILAASHRVSISMLFGEIKETAGENPVNNKGNMDNNKYKYDIPKTPAPTRRPGGAKEIK